MTYINNTCANYGLDGKNCMIATEKDNSEEMFPIVDEDGNIVGAATRGECHGGSKMLHPVVHLHVFNAAGELFLQKRPDWKDIQPGRWDTAVGGHVDFGENVEMALLREAREELALDATGAERLQSYVFESERERELVYPHRLTTEQEPLPSDETAGGRFWSMQEIKDAMGKGILTPNFEQEFNKLFQ